MLTVRLTTHTVESMTFYHTLETFAFCCSYNINIVTFRKNFNSNGVANIFFFGKIAEFFYKFFGRSACFGEVIDLRLKRMFFILVAESELECGIAITLCCSYLCDHTRTCFNDGASSLLARRIEDAGHPNFFSNNRFHFLEFFPQGYTRQTEKKSVFNPGSSPTFSFHS